jgi:flagellar biosynthesis anti-sigma factor FlgM
MKIEGNAPSQAIDLYRKVDTHRQEKASGADKAEQDQNIHAKMGEAVSDEVSISDEAKLRALAQNAIDKLPDVRMDKVEEISKLIESGKYNPDGVKIADSMLSGISIKV